VIMPSGWRRGFKRSSGTEVDQNPGVVVGKALVLVCRFVNVAFLFCLTIQAVNDQ
jgi:hypothetical protein